MAAKELKTAGGIIIPDTAQEKPQEGEVVAVGPGGRDENGDRITPEVKVDGQELLIMKESDIMGVLEGAKSSSKKAA